MKFKFHFPQIQFYWNSVVPVGFFICELDNFTLLQQLLIVLEWDMSFYRSSYYVVVKLKLVRSL